MNNDQLTFIIFNAVLFLAALGIIVGMRKKISAYQNYVYEKKKPIEYLVILVFTIIIYIFLFIFFAPVKGMEAKAKDIKVQYDNAMMGMSEIIDTSQSGNHTINYSFTEEDSGVEITQQVNLEISPNVKRIKTEKGEKQDVEVTRDLAEVLTGIENPTEDQVIEYAVNNAGFTTQNQANRIYDETNISEVSASTKYSKIIVPMNSEVAYQDIYDKAKVEIIDSDYVNGDLRKWRYEEMLRRVVPTRLFLIFPAFLIGTLIFHFVYFNKKIVNKYVNELYEINKFCGFLTYNLTYRNNSKVLIQETLASIDDGQFSRDFELIFFEKDRDMHDKLTDIASIYNYKFFEMYLRIANIIFDEGTSPETIKALEIIQTMGDTYYDKVDLFFRTKEGAMGQIRMIIGISSLIPFIVKMQATDMFTFYQYTNSGYMMIMGFYLLELGIFLLTQKMYKDNKIIKKEGRYV